MNREKKKFRVRAFVTLTIAICGLGLPLTGLAIHVYGHELITVNGRLWMIAHTILGIIFTLFSIWHVVLNRRALWTHLKGVVTGVPWLSREAAVAIALVTVVLILSLQHAFHHRH